MRIRLEFEVVDGSLAKHVIAGVQTYLQRFGIQISTISTDRGYARKSVNFGEPGEGEAGVTFSAEPSQNDHTGHSGQLSRHDRQPQREGTL